MEHRVKGLENVVGEHAVKIEGLHKEVEHQKTQTERLYGKFDEMVKVLYDIKEQLAGNNARTDYNKYIVGLLIAMAGGFLYLLIDKLT